MYKICIFAGTTEGRKIVEFLSTQNVLVTACVATQYGEALLSPADNLTVSAKRLTRDEMIQMLSGTHYDLVIDATHPYAAAVTENIESSCHITGTEYLRLLRSDSSVSPDAVFVSDIAEAVELLSKTEGNILLTTGSKELLKYTGIQDFEQRVYARVLPTEASLTACREAGLKPPHIIAMQGPFSEEMNIAVLKAVSARYLVTKDGGSAGGFDEKVAAAKKAGAALVVVGRPVQKEGLFFAEAVNILCERFGCVYRPCVNVVGIGPGSREAMTGEVRQAIVNADCLIGAKRMLSETMGSGQAVFDAIAPEKIADFILSHHEYQHFTVVMSGDTGFFSGAKKLLPLLSGCDVKVLPGLSSLSYLCAKLNTSHEEVKAVSLHGRNYNIVPDIKENSRVFVLTGGEDGVGNLCSTLVNAGLENVKVSVGEKLSYPDEKITKGTAQELMQESFDALSVVLIENEHPDAVVTHGLPDEAFERGEGEEGIVPMTKSEVRAVSLSKLRLTGRAICWDIGAGTGSVAVEMALQARKGSVYAIEKKAAAVELLQRNKDKFSLKNLTVISGTAPGICSGLPVPTHVFIGGSSGNLRDIIAMLLEKNPSVRIVATAISLETVAELTACMKEFAFAQTEVVSMNVARDKKAGQYHLMNGQNPVYIFTMQNGGAKL